MRSSEAGVVDRVRHRMAAQANKGAWESQVVGRARKGMEKVEAAREVGRRVALGCRARN